jgi:hypothetical protein
MHKQHRIWSDINSPFVFTIFLYFLSVHYVLRLSPRHKMVGRLQTRMITQREGGEGGVVTSCKSCLFVCVTSANHPCPSTWVAFQFTEFIGHKVFTSILVVKTEGVVYIAFHFAPLSPIL